MEDKHDGNMNYSPRAMPKPNNSQSLSFTSITKVTWEQSSITNSTATADCRRAVSPPANNSCPCEPSSVLDRKGAKSKNISFNKGVAEPSVASSRSVSLSSDRKLDVAERGACSVFSGMVVVRRGGWEGTCCGERLWSWGKDSTATLFLSIILEMVGFPVVSDTGMLLVGRVWWIVLMPSSMPPSSPSFADSVQQKWHYNENYDHLVERLKIKWRVSTKTCQC